MSVRTFLPTLVLLIATTPVGAQILRHPTGVNVNASSATTVFLTFGNLDGRVAVEALWCGALEPAAPHVGMRCDPATIYGVLPARYDLSRRSGLDGYTDIMTIPASVSRRAYQTATAGGDAVFFYVRRFIDPRGGPDEYVFVTCRMTGGGAGTPFAITAVQLRFASEEPVPTLRSTEQVPGVSARLHYNGTGMLRGRWEVVRPGDVPPRAEDLLPEASLPLEARTQQRRYTELARFDVFLPPVGEFLLPGPDAASLPTEAEGMYQLLLRIEASDDREGDSSLDAARAGTGLVHSGGVAGFTIPPLRYHVGSGGAVGIASPGFRALMPAAGGTAGAGAALRFTWAEAVGAMLYRLEIVNDAGDALLEAITRGGTTAYEAPGWVRERAGALLRWRVAALGAGGRVLTVTPWQLLQLEPDEEP